MSGLLFTGRDFVREYLRTRVTIVLLLLLPAVFVLVAASVVGGAAEGFGGSASGDAATALGAGWAASFLAGVTGFAQVASSRDADRRLALAGLGPLRVATARIGASVALGLLVTVVAVATLWLKAGAEQPVQTFLAVLAFALIYIGIGAFVGSVLHDALEGSLVVAIVFLMDIYSGPGMSGSGDAANATPTRKASEALMAAASGGDADTGTWLAMAGTALGCLLIAFLAFLISARSRA